MLSQQNAEGDLIYVYRRLLAVMVMMLLLAVLAYRYFGALDTVSSHNAALEKTRLVNMLSMVRSKWLNEGQSERLLLDWERVQAQSKALPVLVTMGKHGLPLPETFNQAGCSALWLQLLGYRWEGKVSFDEAKFSCRFSIQDGDAIIYQLNDGIVTLVTATD